VVPVELMECVANVSEGRDDAVLRRLSEAAASALLDLHRDPHHNRAVFTLAGRPDVVADAARALARTAVDLIDLHRHEGVHPRAGALDVVPFVPYVPGDLPPHDLTAALELRDKFADWLGAELDLPSFLYGPLDGGGARSLPDLRRLAFAPPQEGGLEPDFGPRSPHPTAGATAVGARTVLVAYNIWVSSLETARAVAPHVRTDQVRVLALAVGERAQVSCNLVDPASYGPARLYDAVAALVKEAGGAVEGAELVGLIPSGVLATIPPGRYEELGLSPDDTIESRLTSN
jgi:glutamate formiminotransferase / 5-formyltetrahydrofolate cyclo-ligase